LLSELKTQGKKQHHQGYKPDHCDGDQAGRHVETVVHCSGGVGFNNKK
jgi:hypothetical protein